MDYLKAFIVGGIICALVQILLEKTKMMPGRVMVTLVVSGAILGAIGLYEPFAKWAGSHRASSGLWKHPLERRKGGNRRGRASGYL